MPHHPLAILVIGCGSIGERHLRSLLAINRAPVAACDSNDALLASMAQRYGVVTESNWQEALCSGKYSVVVICTPAPMHVPIAQYALERKIHVLVEKPLSHSLEGLSQLLEVGKRPGLHSAVAFVLHVNPALRQARQFILDGGIGPVRQATVLSGQPFHKLRPDYDRTYYRDHQTGGGAIQDALTHAANWIESVLGPTDSVLCDASHQFLPNVSVEDTVHIAARNGRVAVSYSLNQFQVPNETILQFNSELGSVRIEPGRNRWARMSERQPEWLWTELGIQDRDGPFIAQARAFFDQVEGKPRFLCTLEAGAQTVRYAVASLQSARSGCRVSCLD